MIVPCAAFDYVCAKVVKIIHFPNVHIRKQCFIHKKWVKNV